MYTFKKLHAFLYFYEIVPVDGKAWQTYKMFLTRNSCSDHQSKLVMVADDNSSAKIGSRYAEASSVFEIVEGVLNFDGGLHSIRNYSYESRAIIR